MPRLWVGCDGRSGQDERYQDLLFRMRSPLAGGGEGGVEDWALGARRGGKQETERAKTPDQRCARPPQQGQAANILKGTTSRGRRGSQYVLYQRVNLSHLGGTLLSNFHKLHLKYNIRLDKFGQGGHEKINDFGNWPRGKRWGGAFDECVCWDD